MSTEKRGRGRPKTNNITKDTVFTLRLSPDEVKDLEFLVADTGMTKAEVFRSVMSTFASIRRNK